MEIIAKSTKETEELAAKLAKRLTSGAVIALYGELGSGKTTFTRYFCEALGFESRVQSPTFVIVRRYKDANHKTLQRIHHLDLYRLKDRSELLDLDLDQFFGDKNALTIIEWPEIAEDAFPAHAVRIKFEVLSNEDRKIHVENFD